MKYHEPHQDFVYPDDELAAEQNHYREAARHFLRVMNIMADYIIHSDNKELAIWVTAHALGLAVCEGESMSDRAGKLVNERGEFLTPQALSKAIKEFQNRINI